MFERDRARATCTRKRSLFSDISRSFTQQQLYSIPAFKEEVKRILLGINQSNCYSICLNSTVCAGFGTI